MQNKNVKLWACKNVKSKGCLEKKILLGKIVNDLPIKKISIVVHITHNLTKIAEVQIRKTCILSIKDCSFLHIRWSAVN